MTGLTVLNRGTGTEQDRYRRAVSQIIGDIQKATGADLCDIAEAIDVSSATVCNAYNKRSDLNAMYLARLGKAYGGAFLNPYLALIGIQAAPIERKQKKDLLPVLTRASHKIAMARDPDGPGGATEVPQERKSYLPDLKELQHEIGCTVAEIEEALA